MTIGIHIFGFGQGESIVLQLPDGTAGVIDHFIAGQGPNTYSPMVKFIRERLGLSRLRFVAVTHPHADHCRGICEYLVPAFEAVDSLYVFEAIMVSKMHRCLIEGKKRGPQPEERAMGLRRGTISKEIKMLLKMVKERKSGRYRILQGHEVPLCQGVTIRHLTPSTSANNRYIDSITRAVEMQKLEADSVDHNLACGTFAITYGKATYLFLADAERELWQDLFEAIQEGQVPALPAARLIKVSHHGSENGYFEPLYKSVCGEDTILVVTPFTRHKLPSRDGMNFLRSHFPLPNTILSTNGAAASQTSTLRWHLAGSGELVTVSREWVHDVLNDPERRAFLTGRPVSRTTTGKETLAQDWLYDCAKEPGRAKSLDPMLTNFEVSDKRQHIEDEFRVSLSFDSEGREIPERRHLGAIVGCLSERFEPGRVAPP
jgi:beta-lactamase superfamily II metal-dependent hydrolase